MNRINFLPPWVETNLQPAFYDAESGTVLQQTARMYAKVNQLIRNVNDQNETIDLYIAKFIELHDYVHDYFDNLDVQEEINNKLDDMVEQGTLQEIITDYIQANVAWTFDTVADMKSATNLIAGSYAQTLGFHSIDDGGASIYYITDTGTANEMDVIAVGDLYANLVKTSIVVPEMYGAYGNGVQDDKLAIQECLDKNSIIYFNPKTYKVTLDTEADDYAFVNGITIESNKIVDFRGATIIIPAVDGGSIEKYSVIKMIGDNIIIKNGNIIGDRDDHIGTLSEYGHGIRVFRTTNSKILNCNVTKCTGDGICLNAEYTSSADYICSSNNFVIDGCEISYARRNGISNIGCDDLTISNCYVHDISGTSPQACIDIEGNANPRDEYPKNTIIHGCRLINSGDSYRGILIYDRSYDCVVYDCVTTDITTYGVCTTDGIVTDSIHNYASDIVTLNNIKAKILYNTGTELILNNCDITEDVHITNTSSNPNSIIRFNDCHLVKISGSNNSPAYKLYFDKCKFDFTTLINFEGNIKEVYINNSVLNTVQRIISSKNMTTLKIHNSTIHVDSNASSAIIYDTGLANAELIGNVITGTHTTAFNGVLFNSTALNVVMIGNMCTELGTLNSGTTSSVVSKLNFQDSLNVA